MSEQKHTPGPWRVSLGDTIAAGDRLIADCEMTPHSKRPAPLNQEDAANARRIVACVNACEGISTEQLERFPLDNFRECAQAGVASVVRELELEKQRDELWALLEAIYNAHRTDNNGAYMGEAVLCESFARRARDLIAKCKQ